MIIKLREFIAGPEGWGRAQGRQVYNRLLEFVEANPGVSVFKVSMEGVFRIDISFASETVVELARRYRGVKGFCLIDIDDIDMVENIDAAALKKNQPLAIWSGKHARLIGSQPSRGNRDALAFALSRPQVRAAEYADATPAMSIANASTKFKQLWEQGFLLRRERVAESGGVEFLYQRIG